LRKHKFLFAAFVAALVLGAASACSNNPFLPHAEPRVLEVKSSQGEEFVGIKQSRGEEDGVPFILYTYIEPVISLENRAGFPEINFKRFSAKVTLSDGTVLPTKEFSLIKVLPAGGVADIQFPIMSVDSDIQNVVYPGNNAPRVRDGFVDLILFGTDLNGYEIQIPITVPLKFQSLIFPDTRVPPELAPSPSPTGASSPTSGGQ